MINTITIADTKEIRADRTVDSLIIENKKTKKSKSFCLYNDQGIYFKLFSDYEDFDKFVNKGDESIDFLEFFSDEELDYYLEKLELN